MFVWLIIFSAFSQIPQSKAPFEFEKKREIALSDYAKTLSDIKKATDCISRFYYASDFIKKYGDENLYAEKLRSFFVKRCIRDGKMGMCCDDGRIFLKPEYNYISPFYNGYALFKINDLWGIVDIYGKKLDTLSKDKKEVEAEIEKLRKSFVTNEFIYTQKERLKYFIVEEGELIKDRTPGMVGFLNRNGDMVIPKIYEDLKGFSEDVGLCPARLGGKWGFINRKNKVVIPFIYEDAEMFYEGLAAVKLDGRWGFIDNKGNMIVKNIYDFVMNFSEGRSLVFKEGKYGYIDKSGNNITGLIYDDAESFFDGIAKVKKDGKDGYVDRDGKECCFR